MSRKIECAGKSTAFACEVLPESYELYDRLDLARDRKAIKLIVIWTLLIIVGMVVPMLFVHPVSHAFDMPASKILFCVVAMIVGIIVYTLLHEGVHGMFIKLFTGENPTFGMEIKKGMAYAGSGWFFKKVPYIIIALAPLTIWGIVLALFLKDVDESYFWFLYAVQIFNVTGSAGDIYVSCMIAGMPKEVLVCDSGIAMDFYRPVK